VAFALPDDLSLEKTERLLDRMETQYTDVALIYKGVCNPPLLTITFGFTPDDSEIKRAKRHIAAFLI
jgi:hypothetical protein